MSAPLADTLRPRIHVILEFRFALAYRAPVRLWQGGAWCLPPPANQP